MALVTTTLSLDSETCRDELVAIAESGRSEECALLFFEALPLFFGERRRGEEGFCE
jgi:hypothetical protein